MRPSKRWASRGWRAFAGTLVLGSAGCAPDFEKLSVTRGARGSLGEEVYKTVCRRVAGTEVPSDLDGRDSATLCLGAAEDVAAELEARRATLSPRLVSLAERRARIAAAVDAMLPGSLAGDLDDLLRQLIPFYDPPNDLLPQGSRMTAALMRRIAASDGASRELARIGRSGMVPPVAAPGIAALFSGDERLANLLAAIVPQLFDGDAQAEFKAFREVLALELATATAEDADQKKRREAMERAAWLEDVTGQATFGEGTPLHTVRRDATGLPRLLSEGGGVPYPFLDADGDGTADLDGDRIALVSGYAGTVPEPFACVGETGVTRDAAGRACAPQPSGEADCAQPLYDYTENRDETLLSAMAREAHRLAGSGSNSVVASALRAVPAVFEPAVPSEQRYGQATVAYSAIDREASALLELAHSATAVVPMARYGESLLLTERVLSELEGPVARLLSALKSLDAVSRPGSDSYPAAALAPDHTFWDDLLWEAEKLSRRRLTADGEGAIEATSRAALGLARDVRAQGTPLVQAVPRAKVRHEGALLATFMRFKDEWRLNPQGESKRKPGEPELIGAFTTPVDRSAPDTPATCGKDGCGGLIAGTPFEAYKKPNQNCVVQRAGRPPASMDCGEPSNQSILQRSMGLLWEMAGRSQCNKTILLQDLLNFVGDDPCTVLSEPLACSADAPCTAAFGADFACDKAAGTCIAKPSSRTCALLKESRQRDVNETAAQAAEALAKDYVCPNVPGAPCHAYEAEFPSAFLEKDNDPATIDAAVQPCHLLDLKDVGRVFGRVLTREYVLEVPNPWVRRYLEDIARASDGLALPRCGTDFRITDPTQVPSCVPEAAKLTRDFYASMPAEVDTLGELIEFLLDDTSLFAGEADTRDLRPDAKSLSHVLFAGKEKAGIPLFDGLLLRGAPKACAGAAGLPACEMDDTRPTPAGGCCIADVNNAPLRYRLDTYYGSTSFAWEQPVKLSDGTTLSFLDTMQPLADAFNRLDYVAGRDDPARFEDLAYGLTSIGKLVAEHYDSTENPAAQSTDPDGMWFRRGTGISSYEPLVADALDDGTILPDQAGPMGGPLFDQATLDAAKPHDVFRAGLGLLEGLEGMKFAGGDDGIDVSARVTEALLNPHTNCAGDGGDGRVIAGKGACDADAPIRAPLKRRDGRAYPCRNDGVCADGRMGPRRHFAPLTLAAEAVHSIDLNSRASAEDHTALRSLASAAIQALADVRGEAFESRRLHALLVTLMHHARVRWAEEQAADTLLTYAAETEDEAYDLLGEPVVGAAVALARVLAADPVVVVELDAFIAAALAAERAPVWTLLASDMFQTARSGASARAVARVLSAALAENVDAVIAGEDGQLSLKGSYVESNLRVMGELGKLDEHGVLAQALQHATAPTVDGHAPLNVLTEAVLALQRPEPTATREVDSADLRAALASMADAMQDERRGFERLYRIVRCATSGNKAECD
jgi:hypothetical protein